MSSATKSRNALAGRGGGGQEQEQDVSYIPPEVGDRVYSKFTNGEWYWGVVEKKFWKYGDWCFSIRYDDGDYIKELKTKDGIATVAQFNSDPMFANRRAPATSSSSKPLFLKNVFNRETSMVENNKPCANISDASHRKKRKASPLSTVTNDITSKKMKAAAQNASWKVKGYFFNSQNRKWMVKFAFAKSPTYFGSFDTSDEAELATHIAREELRRWEGNVRTDIEIENAIQAAKQAIADRMSRESTINEHEYEINPSPVVVAAADPTTQVAKKKSKGFHYHIKKKKWQVEFTFAGKSCYIGYFDTEEQAEIATQIARDELRQWEGNVQKDTSQRTKAVAAAKKAVFEELNGSIDEKTPSTSVPKRRGVSFNSGSKKWEVRLFFAERRPYIGRFETVEKANVAAEIASRTLQQWTLQQWKGSELSGSQIKVAVDAAKKAVSDKLNGLKNEIAPASKGSPSAPTSHMVKEGINSDPTVNAGCRRKIAAAAQVQTVKKVGNGVYEIRRGDYVKWNVTLDFAGDDHDFGLFESKEDALHVSASALEKFELAKSISSGGETLKVLARAAAHALIEEIRNTNEELKKTNPRTGTSLKAPRNYHPQRLDGPTTTRAASEKECLKQEDAAVSATKLSRKLVHEADQSLVSDYCFSIMKQMRRCEFTEYDKGKHKKHKNVIGFGGMECIHCAETPYSRKFFPNSIDHMDNHTFHRVSEHVLTCRYCPPNVRNELLDLKQVHLYQTAAPPKGSQGDFLRRIWDRIHTEGDPDTSRLAASHMGEGKYLPGYALESSTLPLPSGKTEVACEDQEMPFGSAIPPAIPAAAAASLSSGVTPPSVRHVGDHTISVLSFLERHKDCLKRSPASFHQWLQGEDVNTMADLLDACTDKEYLNEDMQVNGLRRFKRKLFAREVKNAVATYGLQN